MHGDDHRARPAARSRVEGEPHGTLRFELEPDGDGDACSLRARSQIPEDFRSRSPPAGTCTSTRWQDFLDDGTRVDWPNWPLDRWQAIHDGFYSGELDSERHSSRQAAER